MYRPHPSVANGADLKLHLAQTPNLYLFTGYGAGFVLVNGQRYDRNLIVTPGQLNMHWSATSSEELAEEDLVAVVTIAPQIVLIGTGSKFCFPKPSALRGLIGAKIGFEVMDTRAACRTYNILAQEGRNVAAALMLN